jgi:hypothetical protein
VLSCKLQFEYVHRGTSDNPFDEDFEAFIKIGSDDVNLVLELAAQDRGEML